MTKGSTVSKCVCPNKRANTAEKTEDIEGYKGRARNKENIDSQLGKAREITTNITKMQAFIVLLTVLMTYTAFADERPQTLLLRKKYWGPPAVCHVYVRRFTADLKPECIEYPIDCKEGRQDNGFFTPIPDEFCVSDKVDFPTALDVYIWICYSTLFVCMIEFTVVHYYTKFNTGDPEIQELERERMRQIIRSIPKKALGSRHYNRPMTTGVKSVPVRPFSRRDGGRHSMINRRSKRLPAVSERKVLTPQSSCSNDDQNKEEFQRENVGWRLYYWMMDNGKKTDPFGLAENSISSVDKFARIALPFIFILICIVYYNVYVNTPFSFTFDDNFESHHFR